MTTEDLQSGRFLRTFALALSLGGAAIAAFVGIVDPYGIYGLVRLDGFNAIKPGLSRYQAEIKQELALRIKPQLVILGNSRAEIGFDPQAIATSGIGYNLAIPGTGVSTSAKQLAQLVQAGARPRTVILGVEFIDFLEAAVAPPAPSAPAPPGRGRQFWHFDALFSLTSIKDAVRTLRIQHLEEASTISPNGYNPLKEYRAYARDDGYYKIFRQRAQESAATLRKKSTSALSPEDFVALHRVLLTAADSNADVRLVIYPYHAQMLALFEAAGLWPLFEQWKARLVDEIANMKQSHPSARITLVDFSGFGPYNCERIPRADERALSTQWYWEAGHFKKELGDIVLSRLMAPGLPEPAVPPFGTPLDASTWKANGERIAFERTRCAAAQPELFDSARKLAMVRQPSRAAPDERHGGAQQ